MTILLFLLFLASLAVGIGTSVVQSVKGTENHLVLKPVPVLVSIAPAVLFFSLYLGAYQVDAGTVGVVKRFGNPIGVLQPGLHFVRPIGDTVTEVSVQTKIVKTAEDASSKDLQIVKTEVTLAYHTDKNYALDILVQLNDDAGTRVIVPAILESIKAETSQYDVQALVTERAKVRDGIEERVKARLAPYHIVAETTSITNFAFSKQYEESIEAKQVAEQKAEKAKNDLTRIKVEAQQVAAKAEGDAAAQIANAKGEGESQLIVARAKAEAQKLQRENITPELLQLRTIELMHDKWDGVFPSTYIGSGSSSNPASLLIQPPTHAPKAQEKQ
jgi:regulator of protease activity HflC (stomatin/prohibitin superfamily)